MAPPTLISELVPNEFNTEHGTTQSMAFGDQFFNFDEAMNMHVIQSEQVEDDTASNSKNIDNNKHGNEFSDLYQAHDNSDSWEVQVASPHINGDNSTITHILFDDESTIDLSGTGSDAEEQVENDDPYSSIETPVADFGSASGSKEQVTLTSPVNEHHQTTTLVDVPVDHQSDNATLQSTILVVVPVDHQSDNATLQSTILVDVPVEQCMKELMCYILTRHGFWCPNPFDINLVGSKWVFKTKLKANGTVDRCKARLVAKGFSQLEGIDFEETFSPVVKATTIRVVLTIVVSSKWKIRQLDVKNAFLHGFLQQKVQPPGFIDPQYLQHVCLLKKTLYGFKQAPRAWFDRFSMHLLHLGFICSKDDPSLFTLQTHKGKIFLLLYVDDIIDTGSNPSHALELVLQLEKDFAMKDLDPIHFFLGIEVKYFE
ncbi:uncharacterized protein [Solanum tuberosum]|uniref:uncharacterized protein n=1 Tax=Solanum tuberosum TaxID=4113 RepID=UPI00073A0A53|nr:PREDICTED: uncharacterized protein LOC107062507 [Solanum tuberosum]